MKRTRPQSADVGAFVCVFGIQGVGKTTRIGDFVRAHSGWRSLAAGRILSKAADQTPEALRSAPARAIKENQLILEKLILEIRRAEPDGCWLLDAHSVIDNGTELVPVPMEVVRALAPTRLIFLYDKPERILARRQNDHERDRPLRSIEQLAVEQDLASETALEYSVALKLFLYRVAADDPDAFRAAVLAEQ